MWKPSFWDYGEGRCHRKRGSDQGDLPSNDKSCDSTGVVATACMHMEEWRNTGNLLGGVVQHQLDPREGKAGPNEVAERLVVPRKPSNAGGGKEPQFKANARRSA